GGAVTRIPERQWVKRPDEWPPPEVECRPATPEQIPQGAKRIMTLAVAHGWRVRVMYTRGAVGLHNGRMADVVSVRPARDGVSGWAPRIGRRFGNAQRWRQGSVPANSKLASVRQEVARERI